MPELLLYLLKVNVALVLFYLAYYVALRRLTFYHLNRLFLVFGIVFSTVYPFIDLSELFAKHEPIANAYIVKVPVWAITPQTITQTPTFDYWQLPVYLFWAGVIVMLIRFIVQLMSLYKIHMTSEPANYKHIGFRKVKSISQAFSFWQTIYINPEQHHRDELEKILHHELIHITGWHTLDVLLAELSTVFYWFNPGAWLMKKAVKENLEFIADQNVVNTGVDKKEYQYLLLKVVGATQPQIANQFNFPSLKRRIAMMNKMPSARAHLLKFLAAVPVATVLLFAANSVAKPTGAIAGYSEVGPDIYIREALTYSSVCWNAPNTLTITPIVGEAEIYNLDNEQHLAEADRKYGLYLPDHDKYNELPATTIVDTKTEAADDTYKAFYARNPDVKELAWLSGGKLIVKLKSGKNEMYQFGDKQSMATATKKYGNLPSTPPVAVRDKVSQAPAQNTDINELIKQLKGNRAIKSVRTKKVDGRDAILISPKGGGTEVYFIGDAASVAELERKYGVPELPPPPPPAPAAPDAPPIPPAPTDDAYREVNKAFFEQNPGVSRLFWLVTEEKGKEQQVTGFVLRLKTGEIERYNYSDRESISAYKKKYGKLPVIPETFTLPAPPPPAPAAPDAPALKIKDSFNLNQTPGPTYYIDGVEASPEALKELDPKQIHSVNVFKGEAAKEALGDKAYYGVISIVTEKNKNSEKVKEFNQKFAALPAPPPPVKHNEPLVPASGAKLVEDEKTVTYILWPNDVTKREFEVARQAFAANGFDLKFKEYKDASGEDAINITIASKKLNTGTSAVHNLANLAAHNNVLVVKGFKDTGKFILGTTIPPEK